MHVNISQSIPKSVPYMPTAVGVTAMRTTDAIATKMATPSRTLQNVGPGPGPGPGPEASGLDIRHRGTLTAALADRRAIGNCNRACPRPTYSPCQPSSG